MTFGCGDMVLEGKTTPTPWLLNQEQTDEMVKTALDNGINFFDTANVYNSGTSEIFLGKSIKKYAKREDVVIATKVRFNEGELSPEAIERECNESLKRLDTTYIDLYIIHRYDYKHPYEETMKALDKLVKAGKVKALGCSAMFPYQLYKMNEYARKNNLTPFVSIQNHYNLIYREEEREMTQLIDEEGMVMTPYSPLAAGRLAKYNDTSSTRTQKDPFAKAKYDGNKEIDEPVIERVHELSEKKKIPMGQISMAWLLSKKNVASPIVGVTKISHLMDAIKAVGIKLTEEEIKYLEEPYQPHKVVGALKREQQK
jgi:aryl-alcohol dehydrogenase-like predicted oxidoreductase